MVDRKFLSARMSPGSSPFPCPSVLQTPPQAYCLGGRAERQPCTSRFRCHLRVTGHQVWVKGESLAVKTVLGGITSLCHHQLYLLCLFRLELSLQDISAGLTKVDIFIMLIPNLATDVLQCLGDAGILHKDVACVFS